MPLTLPNLPFTGEELGKSPCQGLDRELGRTGDLVAWGYKGYLFLSYKLIAISISIPALNTFAITLSPTR